MAVFTGPPLYPGSGTFPGNTTFPGQGAKLRYEILMSFDDSSASIPTWTYVTPYLRALSVQRGRASELADMDAGTATLTFDNRDRRFDPTHASGPYFPNLRPMNRLWIQVRFNGACLDVFKGYIESYEQQVPDYGKDALTVVRATDESKVLVTSNIRNTDPPRDTYGDLIQFDNPTGYWKLKDDATGLSESAVIGPQLRINTSVAGNTISAITDTAIIGEVPDPLGALQVDPGKLLESELVNPFEAFDWSGLTTGSVSFWFKVANATPAVASFVVDGMASVWRFTLNTNGTLSFYVINNSSTTFTATSTTTIQTNTWTHAAGVLNGGGITLYINGVVAATAAFSGVVKIQTVGTNMAVGPYNSASATAMNFNHLAIYRTALSATRIAAHYDAGAKRGFPLSQLPGQRIGAVLDSISSQAPRNIRPGARPLTGQYVPGKQALDTIRQAEKAEAVDAVMFIARDGTVTFLDGGHRAVSPWNTTQLTFGDAGGSELPFMDVQIDFSDSFLANEWNVTRDSGLTQTAFDTTSISRYQRRSQSLTDLKLRDDSDALAVAAAMLAKYKEPFTRVLTITPQSGDMNVVDAVFRLELGDRIRILMTPLGGGSRFDQTLFVQSIALDDAPDQAFPRIVLGVSPV